MHPLFDRQEAFESLVFLEVHNCCRQGNHPPPPHLSVLMSALVCVSNKTATKVANISGSGLWTMQWRQSCSVTFSLQWCQFTRELGCNVWETESKKRDRRELGRGDRRLEEREKECEFLKSCPNCEGIISWQQTRLNHCYSWEQRNRTEGLANMMEVVLNRLRDFSRKTSTFDDCKPAGQSACRDPSRRAEGLSDGCTAAEEVRKLDIESALAWLRQELVRIMLGSNSSLLYMKSRTFNIYIHCSWIITCRWFIEHLRIN